MGTGVFEVFFQEQGEHKPTLRTKGTVRVYFDRGKYHLHFDYERMLYPTAIPDNTRFVDRKPDQVVIIFDGVSTYEITWSDRISPTGCKGDVRPGMQTGWSGFPFKEPARLWIEMLNIEQVIQDLGGEFIKTVKQPGGYRCEYRAKAAPQVRFEFEILRDIDFNIASKRVFNEGVNTPAVLQRAEWTKTKDVKS